MLDFSGAVLAGLASDGGLYVPEFFPEFSAFELKELSRLDYPALAARILRPFCEGSLDFAVLERLCVEAYAEFRHPAIAPLVQIDRKHWVLELFHGPTLAFKDFALQLLGRLLDHLLQESGGEVTILGATSGDTGSAAIAACRGRARMRSVILYPHGRVSEVQRRQMTTVADANIQAVAIDGSFDDCQALVKAAFNDRAFATSQKLAAVNSINLARVLAQAVYYFYAVFNLGGLEGERVAFSVPTGNFGDIYAGYVAKRMGLPMGPLVIATNQNDILARTLHTGTYATGAVHPSHSPSMDIQVASNFERLLYDLVERDAGRVGQMMQSFDALRSLPLADDSLVRLRADFLADAVDDAQTVNAIRTTYAQNNYLLDPHTAVALSAAQRTLADHTGPVVSLATAHPAKFPAVVEEAVGIHPPLPPHMADLYERPERITRLPNDLRAVQEFILTMEAKHAA